MRQPFKIFRLEQASVCKIIERVNRFVVRVEIKGNPYNAHINNTGRLHEFLVKSRKGFCLENTRPGKTDCRLFAVEERGLAALIDTQFQMRAFERGLEMNQIPWLKGCRLVKRNVWWRTSLLDYLLACWGQDVFLEVKSAVLRERDSAMYPDCPSTRGQKHIQELSEHVKGGGRGVILFMAALPDVKAFRPNKAADPKLFELLKAAQQGGVEIRAIGLYFNPEDLFVYFFNPDLKINLS